MEPPGFTSVDTSDKAAKSVSEFSLGESATPTVDPAVVRAREARDARDKARQDVRFAKGRGAVAVNRAKEALETAEKEFKQAKAALPSRSVGRFLGGTRRRRNVRKRKTRSKRRRTA